MSIYSVVFICMHALFSLADEWQISTDGQLPWLKYFRENKTKILIKILFTLLVSNYFTKVVN